MTAEDSKRRNGGYGNYDMYENVTHVKLHKTPSFKLNKLQISKASLELHKDK